MRVPCAGLGVGVGGVPLFSAGVWGWGEPTRGRSSAPVRGAGEASGVAMAVRTVLAVRAQLTTTSSTAMQRSTGTGGTRGTWAGCNSAAAQVAQVRTTAVRAGDGDGGRREACRGYGGSVRFRMHDSQKGEGSSLYVRNWFHLMLSTRRRRKGCT